MDFHNLTIGGGLLISAFSMLIVFAVLICISYLIDLTALLINGKRKKIKAEVPAPVLEEAEALVPDSRTAAIITAAVTAYLGSASSFTIRSIERRKAQLSDWEAAGIRDSVRRPY